MTPLRLDLSVTIQVGSYRRTVPAIALAAVLHLRPGVVRQALLGLLRAASHCPLPTTSAGEPTEGDRGRSIDSTEKNLSDRSDDQQVRAREELPPDDDVCVQVLVERLADPAGARALRRLVERHPRSRLEEALRRTLRVPAARIAQSRAAYFTAVVRSLASHSSSSSYDLPSASVTP